MPTPAADFNPFDPAFRADPYPSYHLLRNAAPVMKSPQGMWILSRYADAQAALRDKRFGRNLGNAEWYEEFAAQARLNPAWRMQQHWMLVKDPPDHTRLRSLVSKAFTPKAVHALEPRIQAIADGLIERVRVQGEMDLIADFAYPLPVTVIAELLGVPSSGQADFRAWSKALIPTLDPIQMTPAGMSLANQATLAFEGYFRDLISRRRADPQDDLLSALIAAEEAGDKLTEDELIATCVLLLVAGHETTMNLIGNGMLALLRHPEQLETLRAQPELAENAVEELLRFDSPVQMTGRTLAGDVSYGDQSIGKGEQVMILIGAANRDPEHFPEPDTLDLAREEVHHLSFGNGIHYCLGAPLARVEGRIALLALLELGELKLAAKELQWNETITLRGLRSLPVVF